jgi:hypothetical protein
MKLCKCGGKLYRHGYFVSKYCGKTIRLRCKTCKAEEYIHDPQPRPIAKRFDSHTYSYVDS